jgi:hypothetical protein
VTTSNIPVSYGSGSSRSPTASEAPGTRSGLAVWRLRALHELGTIDMFDHAGEARPAEARRIAAELGAASTGAVIDLQLTAAAIFRFELDQAEQYAGAALATSSRLRLEQIRATALVFLAEVYALRRVPAELERFIALAARRRPGIRRSKAARWRARAGCWRCSQMTGPAP